MLVCLGGAGVYALLARGAGRPASAIGGTRGATASASTASGPVWYTRTVRSMHESLPAGGITLSSRGFTHGHGPEVRFDLRVSEETWVGVDGTIRDRTVVAAVRFRSRADRAKWLAYGRPVPNFNNVWLGWISHDGIDVAGGRFPPQPGYQAGEWLWPLRQGRRGQPVYLSAAARAAERAGGAARPAEAGRDSARSAPGIPRRPAGARAPIAERVRRALGYRQPARSTDPGIAATRAGRRCDHDARRTLSTNTHTMRSGVPASP